VEGRETVRASVNANRLIIVTCGGKGDGKIICECQDLVTYGRKGDGSNTKLNFGLPR
jgi:hypothetical protein